MRMLSRCELPLARGALVPDGRSAAEIATTRAAFSAVDRRFSVSIRRV
jgi:hypothetical protein